jgi:hypothetical protein
MEDAIEAGLKGQFLGWKINLIIGMCINNLMLTKVLIHRKKMLENENATIEPNFFDDCIK